MARPRSTLTTKIANRMAGKAPHGVWTPADFHDLGKRDAIDKALQRLERSGNIRRIDRGLYDKLRVSSLTNRHTAPDYQCIIDALARRSQARMLVDGLTAANDLGLTTAVPGKAVIHTDMRRAPITLDNLTIEFRLTAPSKLYWAGRPAMRVVQALHWLKDKLPDNRVEKQLVKILSDPAHEAIRKDLIAGLKTLPSWMLSVVKELLDKSAGCQTRRP